MTGRELDRAARRRYRVRRVAGGGRSGAPCLLAWQRRPVLPAPTARPGERWCRLRAR